MKKSLLILSSIILVFAVVFTSCGKEATFTDEYGTTHVAVTEKGGVTKQDEYGNLIEVVSDADGKTRTQIAEFPVAMTNKAKTWVENGAVRMKIPKDWRILSFHDKFMLKHSGECTNTGTADCEINFRYGAALLEEKYNEYLQIVVNLISVSGECSELKEYEVKLFGDTVKAISYKFDKSDIYCYCYFIQKGLPVIEIESYVYDKCYSEEDFIAFLEENCTIKDLGGEIPTAASQTTTTTTAASAD